MISKKKPSPHTIQTFLEQQRSSTLSYPEVGATRETLPSGYSINHFRQRLGNGNHVFDEACNGLKSWQQLQLGWVDCWPCNAPLEAGEQVAVLGRAFGLWWLNACRVVYTIDSRDDCQEFGYAHGTLPAHLATGEERFLVEMTSDEQVWIDILAFSRPNTVLARIGYPVMRRAQRKFAKQSAGRLHSVVMRNIKKW